MFYLGSRQGQSSMRVWPAEPRAGKTQDDWFSATMQVSEVFPVVERRVVWRKKKTPALRNHLYRPSWLAALTWKAEGFLVSAGRSARHCLLATAASPVR